MPRMTASQNVDALAALPSLGATSAQMLVDAGVPDVATLIALGPIECFRMLRFRFGRRVTINYVYALECAIQQMDWRLLQDAHKAELKAQAKQAIRALELTLDGPAMAPVDTAAGRAGAKRARRPSGTRKLRSHS